MTRRVNIKIHDDIDPAMAVTLVARVMAGGRVSGDGEYYCWGSRFSNNVTVITRGPGKRFENSDSFVVYKEKKNEEAKEAD
jgi:hypothetical protein